ncbi:MAG: Aminomethyltransferase [Gemmatimonadaceae bacterium]|nr:Aminomethyltransferase [Gemmatimonadaceae bacterium]
MTDPVRSRRPASDNPYRLPAYISGPAEEYAAFRSGAVLIDRRARGRMLLAGEQARSMLTGLVTNDVVALGPSHGLYAAALTLKGKIVADLRIYARQDALWLDVAPLAWEGWWSIVRKYINPRLARYEDLTTAYATLGIYGPAAASSLAGVLGIGTSLLLDLAPYAHRPLDADASSGFVACIPDSGSNGFEIWVPADAFETWWRRVADGGVVPAGAVTADVIRVEAGRPEWGRDMDDTTLAQEANLDQHHAISYTKGCYTGQETVARLHFRGHVNRHLRGLLLPDDSLPPPGSALATRDDKAIGDVRSVALSPRLGGIALAMIRRDVEAGTRVLAGDSRIEGQVVDLPFV